MGGVQEKSENTERFLEKYRVASARLNGWDYSSVTDGAYFVTMCTKDREHFFGEVSDSVMRNSFLGDAVNSCWREISEHFPWVITDEFVVMPNHVHGVLFVKSGVSNIDMSGPDTCGRMHIGKTQIEGGQMRGGRETQCGRKTQNLASLRGEEGRDGDGKMRETGNVFGPQRKNLASVIRGFKVGVTKRARKEGLYFFWQPRFYDHIIRNECELNRIREYIVSNPKNWDHDSENTRVFG